MGANHSSKNHPPPGEEVNFSHFDILRAIGKGSFGKVCIVQKLDRRGKMYAMKYVNKSECVERGALKNVAREVEILSKLEHPCLVNLWFSFQDLEDLFMVSDLLLGGDLRYHLQQKVQFSEESVTLFVAEIALALDYLRHNKIVHRDIKPDNILLDENGHAHVTDFNIATALEENQLATSMSGTKPYMAPEIYKFACDEYGMSGYSFTVDWWSLGVLAWETLAGVRPFEVHTSTSSLEALAILTNKPEKPNYWSEAMCELIDCLLEIDPQDRCCSLETISNIGPMKGLNFDDILAKKVKPQFTPPKDHLNCDPIFELQELLTETKPLHEKEKRLAKQKSIGTDSKGLSFIPEYKVYNREQEIERRKRELKEKQWEEELNKAMLKAEERISFISGIRPPPSKHQRNQQELSKLSQEKSTPQSSDHLKVTQAASITARINGSPNVNRRHSAGPSSEIEFIDASPEHSTS